MYNSTNDIADIVLTELSHLRPQGTTHRELQQFLYLLNADTQLISEPFKYFRYGPTLLSIHQRFQHLESTPINRFNNTHILILDPIMRHKIRKNIIKFNTLSNTERFCTIQSLSAHHYNQEVQ